MKTLFKVIAQSDPQPYTKSDNTVGNRSTITLQEIGGRFEDSYVATMFDNLALCKYYPGDIVWASLRFEAKQGKDRYFQDCTVQNIISFSHH